MNSLDQLIELGLKYLIDEVSKKVTSFFDLIKRISSVLGICMPKYPEQLPRV
jgi:hypothetical protein